MSEEPFDRDDDSLPVSKSERKRQMHQLQTLGEKLIELKAEQLEKLPLSLSLSKAIAEAASIRKREARRRHLQYIGKLMRKEGDESIAAIEKLLDSIQRAQQQRNNRFHAIEAWRDRILANNPGEIESFLAEYPDAERQWLRQIVRQHQQEVAQNKPPSSARKLFQYLREVIEN